MKQLTVFLVVLALTLSGCALTRSLTNNNDDQLTYGKGVVVTPLAKVNGEWVFDVETTEDGRTVTLVCPPELLKECGNLEYFDMASYTGESALAANKMTLTRLKIDKK